MLYMNNYEDKSPQVEQIETGYPLNHSDENILGLTCMPKQNSYAA